MNMLKRATQAQPHIQDVAQGGPTRNLNIEGLHRVKG